MKRVLPILTSIVVLSSAASAAGQQPTTATNAGPAPTALQIQTAKDHFEKGLRIYDQAEFKNDAGLYEQAYLEFVRAWATYKTNPVLWNLALSALHTKRSLEALGYFHEYDRRLHVLADPKNKYRKMLSDYLDQLNALTGHITVDADPGESVLLDGKPMGNAPLAESLDIQPGRHVLKAGRQSAEMLIAAGETHAAKLRSVEAPVAAPVVVPKPAPATPGAIPVLEGGPEGAPIATPDAVNADKGAISQTRLWLTVGLAAGSAALFTGTIVFSQKATSEARDAADAKARTPASACPCSNIDSSLQSAHSDRGLSVGFGIAGVALAAGAVGSWFFIHDDRKQTNASPLLAPGLVGAAWTTRF